MKFDYSPHFEFHGYEYEEKQPKRGPRKKVDTRGLFKESLEVRYEHAITQFYNELYDLSPEERFNLETIDYLLLKNLLWKKFTRNHIAKITGQSTRTVRNKINRYGLKDL